MVRGAPASSSSDLLEVDKAFHGYAPVTVVDDVINSFNDYACDAADAMQQVLLQEPQLRDQGATIEQGVDRWLLKVQRAGDKNFDKFELYALNNVFRVPPDLQLEAVEQAQESSIDTELESLWAELRQELANKDVLQRRVAAASREVQKWEAHRPGVETLCGLRRGEVLGRVLQDARQLDVELRRGREQLQSVSTTGGPLAGLQQALSTRRVQISTEGVQDLQVLSSLLCT